MGRRGEKREKEEGVDGVEEVYQQAPGYNLYDADRSVQEEKKDLSQKLLRKPLGTLSKTPGPKLRVISSGASPASQGEPHAFGVLKNLKCIEM